MAFLADGDLALRARAQDDLAFAVQGLRGIAHDVEQRLDELLGIGLEIRDAGIVIADQRQPGMLFGRDQVAHMLDDPAATAEVTAKLRERVASSFSVDSMVEGVLAAYRDALAVLSQNGRR